MAKLINAKSWSVRETEGQVRKMLRGSGEGRSIVAAAVATVSELPAPAGLRVQLHQRADGGGKLVIEFEDELARDAALKRLGIG